MQLNVRNTLTIAATAFIMLSLSYVLQHPASAASKNYNLSTASIVITSTTVSYCNSSGDKTLSEPYNGGINGDAITISQTDSSTANTITVTDSANVNITIDHIGIRVRDDVCAFSIESGSKVNLTIHGTNSFSSGINKAGISVPEGAELSISASSDLDSVDYLFAHGGAYGAGIGGGKGISCGNIIINGGVIFAGCGHLSTYEQLPGNTGKTIGEVFETGTCGAAIGGGAGGSGGKITINNGIIRADGSGSAAIGGGDGGDGGTVSIAGGSVEARGLQSIAIGSGRGGGDSTVHISGGRVIALGVAGIGTLNAAAKGNLTVSGGIVYATGLKDGCCLGIGKGDFLISGGTVYLNNPTNYYFSGVGVITLNGGSIGMSYTPVIQSNGKEPLYQTTVEIPSLKTSGPSPFISVSSFQYAVSYSVDGGSVHTCFTNDSERIFLWLPVKADGLETTVKITCGKNEYVASGIVKPNGMNMMTADETFRADNALFLTNIIKATRFSDDDIMELRSKVTEVDVIYALTALNRVAKDNLNTAKIIIDSNSFGSVKIPTTSLDKISSSRVGALLIHLATGTIQLDTTALDEIRKQASDSVTFMIKPIGSLSTGNAADSVANSVFSVEITSGSRSISSLVNAEITVTIPYSEASSPKAGTSTVYAVVPDKNIPVIKSTIDTISNSYIFKTSQTGVFYVHANDIHFRDVSGNSREFIDYLAARNIFNGTGNAQFSPNAEITRAQFITILARLSGDDLGKFTSSSFIDVKKTDWYYGSVEWAHSNGIALGVDGRFNPNDPLTHQDLAVLLVRYAKLISFTLYQTVKEISFSDSDNVAAYAADAVNTLQKAGVITGNSDGSFKPASITTRAEAAKMLALFLKAMVF